MGVHLCLDEEAPLLPADEISTLVGRDGHFLSRATLLRRLLLNRGIDLGHVHAELDAQIRRCRDAGVSLSHFDGHGHVHVYPGISDVVIDLAGEHEIASCRLPLEPIGFLGRGFNLSDYLNKLIVAAFSLHARQKFRAAGIVFPDVFYGMMYGGRLSEDLLHGLLRKIALIRDAGTVEIMSHPGRFVSDELSDYEHWNYNWASELNALQSLSGNLADYREIEIVSFKELV